MSGHAAAINIAASATPSVQALADALQQQMLNQPTQHSISLPNFWSQHPIPWPHQDSHSWDSQRLQPHQRALLSRYTSTPHQQCHRLIDYPQLATTPSPPSTPRWGPSTHPTVTSCSTPSSSRPFPRTFALPSIATPSSLLTSSPSRPSSYSTPSPPHSQSSLHTPFPPCPHLPHYCHPLSFYLYLYLPQALSCVMLVEKLILLGHSLKKPFNSEKILSNIFFFKQMSHKPSLALIFFMLIQSK